MTEGVILKSVLPRGTALQALPGPLGCQAAGLRCPGLATTIAWMGTQICRRSPYGHPGMFFLLGIQPWELPPTIHIRCLSEGR